jgi:hypothetical protein
VGFYRDQPKTAADGDLVRLSGYDAVVREDTDGEACTVFVNYREYGGRNAETYAEMLRLDVRSRGQRPVDELCGMATALARSAAAELPAS